MPVSFEDIVKSKIFKDKELLRAIIPPSGKLVSRDKQEQELILELGHILKNMPASNLFLFGFPGTGKTSLMMNLCNKLETLAKKSIIELKIVYINCEQKKTDTAIIMEIYNQISDDDKKLTTGINRSWLIGKFKGLLQDKNYNLLIILDEIDYVLKHSGDEILYLLSRLKDEVKISSRISTTIISNNKDVPTYIETRTQSSFGKKLIFFPPYNKEELLEILKDRVKYSFYPNVVDDEVLKEISEIESKRRGDAREAIELLEYVGKIAIAKKSKKIMVEYVKEADGKMEMDTIVNTLSGLTLNQKILYLSIIKKKDGILEEIYNEYKNLCGKNGEEFLTERRVRGIVDDFINMGLVQSQRKKSKKTGRQANFISPNFTEKLSQIIDRFLTESIKKH